MENALKELVKVMNDVTLSKTNAFVLLGDAGIYSSQSLFFSIDKIFITYLFILLGQVSQ